MMGQIFQTDFILYFTEMICTRKTTSASLILVQNVLVSTIFFEPEVQFCKVYQLDHYRH